MTSHAAVVARAAWASAVYLARAPEWITPNGC
ncbi:MAG: hypothetical protein R2795_15225 [Saprospiraceae bacterium]